MSKVTSKYQVTIPRSVARAHGILPGSDIVFESAGEVIRVRTGTEPLDEGFERERALRWFDEATRRQAARDPEILKRLKGCAKGRGWTRDELYAERLER